MRDPRGAHLAAVGLLLLLMLGMGTPSPGRAMQEHADFTPTAYVYLPAVFRQPPPTAVCPTYSDRTYTAGTIYQFEKDDPVRPAETHGDKNLEMRGYVLRTDGGFRRDLVDYGSDDPTQPTQPPQLATLFDPYRMPEISSFYRVHDWVWQPSPQTGYRGDPIDDWPVTALGLRTTPGEIIGVPKSGYTIGGNPPLEVMILYADEDTVALRYTREDSSGAPGYTVHVDNLCVDPNLLARYRSLDDPDGPRYVYVPPEQRPYTYDLPHLVEGEPIGVARDEEIVVAVVDSGSFMDPRSCNEWWQIRPGYSGCTTQ